MAKFMKEVFYSTDEWLKSSRPDLLEDSETYWLCTQARLAREALEKRVQEVMSHEDTKC